MNLDLLKNNASSFKKSAERSMEKRKINNEQLESLLVPATVNLAFSIELYLKYLLTKNGKHIKGHKLFELFKSLDETNQNRIINSSKYNVGDFKSLLSKHTDIFIDWRYLYESEISKTAKLDFLSRLSNSLEEIAKEIM